MSEQKNCSKCGVLKALTEFHRNRLTRDGHRSVCKQCESSYHMAHYRRPEQSKRARLSEKHRRDALRLKLIQRMGGQCALCGEAEPIFLTIDHIHGGGDAHRKKIGQSHLMWSEVLRDPWPKLKYRLLCFNCNFGLHGHTEEEVKAAIARRQADRVVRLS